MGHPEPQDDSTKRIKDHAALTMTVKGNWIARIAGAYFSGSDIWVASDFSRSVLISNFCWGARSTSVEKVWYPGKLMAILRWPGATIKPLPNSRACPT